MHPFTLAHPTPPIRTCTRTRTRHTDPPPRPAPATPPRIRPPAPQADELYLTVPPDELELQGAAARTLPPDVVAAVYGRHPPLAVL